MISLEEMPKAVFWASWAVAVVLAFTLGAMVWYPLLRTSLAFHGLG